MKYYQTKLSHDLEIQGGYWRTDGVKVEWADRWGRIWWPSTEICAVRLPQQLLDSKMFVEVSKPL